MFFIYLLLLKKMIINNSCAPFWNYYLPWYKQDCISMYFTACPPEYKQEFIHALLKRLEQLRAAICQTPNYRFYSSSLLLVYDACPRYVGSHLRASISIWVLSNNWGCSNFHNLQMEVCIWLPVIHNWFAAPFPPSWILEWSTSQIQGK